MANIIHILDCTLRDGGYVNDWRFGEECARGIIAATARSGVEYAEIGFIRLCDYESEKLVFSDMAQITRIFIPAPVKLAAMVEIGYGYPVASFPLHSDDTVDLVRLVIWKRLIKEGLSYAKSLLDKGYEVAIQVTRTDQYTLAEFADLVSQFSNVGVNAVYIVDTFGLFTKKRLLEYACVADENLADQCFLGYHAHNNMQQAFSNAVAFCECSRNHELMLDASVMGIGRGAGNLCLELLEKYLCENLEGTYCLPPLYDCADRFIRPIAKRHDWGYSVPYLLSAQSGRNPSFVEPLIGAGLTYPQMCAVFDRMRQCEVGIRYDMDMCRRVVMEVTGMQM